MDVTAIAMAFRLKAHEQHGHLLLIILLLSNPLMERSERNEGKYDKGFGRNTAQSPLT